MIIETDNKHFNRDTNSRALLSNDLNALRRHKEKNKMILDNDSRKEKRIIDLENDIYELKKIVSNLIGEEK